MITDIYTIDGADSRTAALDGLAKAGRFAGMGDEAATHLRELGGALLRVADGLENARQIKLWMETAGGEAVVHLKTDCTVDLEEEEKLKAMSTTGENTQRKGLFAKIKGAFEEMAIAENEDLNTLGYVPEMEEGAYPVLWAFTPTLPENKEHWDERAATHVRQLANRVDVGFSSEQVEIAAHLQTRR